MLNKNLFLQSLFNQASQARTTGDCDLAEKLYAEILSLKPDSAAAHHELGILMIEKGRPMLACRILKQAIKYLNGDSDCFYHLGEALSATGNSIEAVVYYKKAININPNEPDYYFALGNAYMESSCYQAAIETYKIATRLNPQDFEAHNNLGNALFKLGLNKLSINQYENAININPEYAKAHLNLSASLKLEGRVKTSLYHAQQALEFEPNEVSCYLNLAEILFNLQKYNQSHKLYLGALEIAQSNQEALRGCAKCLMQKSDVFEALVYFKKALNVATDNENLVIEMTSCLIRLQKYSTAKPMLETLLAGNPRSTQALFNYGLCLQAEGDFTSALIAHNTCWKRDRKITQCAYHIACNGKYKANINDISLIKKQLADDGFSIHKKIHLNFALAKILENQKHYDQAFKYYKQANALKAEIYPFNQKKHIDYIERLKSQFSALYFSQHRNFGLSNKRLIFIVGMPRSGSTLVEQILASHPFVYALGEHMAFPVIVKKITEFLDCKEQFPECVANLSKEKSKQLAKQYLDYIGIDLCNKPITTDKMLGNFLRLGLITLLFPNSRIVHCQRNPLDTCVSCFAQNFAHGLRFSTSLNHLGTFYNSYNDLMKHWQENLPLAQMTIQYEQLVHNKQENVERLLEFCNLPWNSKCMNFHDTKRTVSTASFWQVKQPSYTNSIGRWKQYRAHLNPLKKALKQSDQAVSSP